MNSNRRFIILGAGGFIGGSLSSYLIRRNKDVILVGKNSQAEDDNTTILNEHITDFSILTKHLRDNAPNVVFYMINTTSPADSAREPALDLESNLALFVKYLMWAKRHPSVHTVFTSSGGTVYGNPHSIPITETSSTKPISFYGLAKLTSEKYLETFGDIYGINYTIARISNPYGEGQHTLRNQGIVPKLLQCLQTGEPFPIIGDGSMVRDYIYIEDLISALYLCATTPSLNKQVINIGSGKGLSITQVVQLIEKVFDAKVTINHLPKREGDVLINILSIQKITALTNWKPITSFAKGLGKLRTKK